MARRKKKRSQGNVELNLAAMLDMAFQLLAFFIATFRPAPVEGQMALHLPPAMPATMVKADQQAGSDEDNKNPVTGLETFTITVFATPSGSIESMAIGESTVGRSVDLLGARLKTVLADPTTKFEQVVIQVGATLNYEELMSVIEMCGKQKLADGRTLTKFSFVELPGEKK